MRARFEEANRQSFTIADLPPGTLAPLEDVIETAEKPMPGVQYRIRNPWRMRPNYPVAIRFRPDGIGTLWADGWLLERIPDVAMVAVVDETVSITASHTSFAVEHRKYRKTVFWAHQPVVLWMVTTVALVAAVLVVSSGNAWPWGLATAVPVLWALIQGRGRDPSLERDTSKNMEEAARLFLPEDSILPPPRSPKSE